MNTDTTANEIPPSTSGLVLRHVIIGATGYRIMIWMTGKFSACKKNVGFALYAPGQSVPICHGDHAEIELGCDASSDRALRAVIRDVALDQDTETKTVLMSVAGTCCFSGVKP